MDIKIYNDDCFKVLNSLPDDSVQCMVTSPPYNKGYFTKNKKSNQIWSDFQITYNTYSDDMPIEQYEKWMIDFINLCMKKLKSHGSLFFNHKPIRYNNQVYFPLNFILRSDAKIYQEIIWDRHNSPNIRNDCLLPCTERIYWLVKDKPSVYRSELEKEFISEFWHIVAKKNKLHPAPFPVQLPLNCIKLTTQPGDLVIDPFMGIGTTGVACKQLDRDFIGIDTDKVYCETAIKEIFGNEPHDILTLQ